MTSSEIVDGFCCVEENQVVSTAPKLRKDGPKAKREPPPNTKASKKPRIHRGLKSKAHQGDVASDKKKFATDITPENYLKVVSKVDL